MVKINGVTFYEEPTSCGTCPFFSDGSTSHPMSQGTEKGHCRQFDENHKRWRSVPRRCEKLFKKAFQIGGDLVIVFREP